jgi:hypothetical protein
MLIFKLISRQLIPLAREHILFEARRKMAVVPLNHAY